jgi:hypothetical protein
VRDTNTLAPQGEERERLKSYERLVFPGAPSELRFTDMLLDHPSVICS